MHGAFSAIAKSPVYSIYRLCLMLWTLSSVPAVFYIQFQLVKYVCQNIQQLSDFGNSRLNVFGWYSLNYVTLACLTNLPVVRAAFLYDRKCEKSLLTGRNSGKAFQLYILGSSSFRRPCKICNFAVTFVAGTHLFLDICMNCFHICRICQRESTCKYHTKC